MLRASALRFKAFKKKNFLTLFRISGFPGKISFQATDETELKDIGHFFGSSVRITLLSNFPGILPDPPIPAVKKPGELFIIYVGRIHPIKNLAFLIQAMQKLSGRIKLTIVGSVEDSSYWQKCESLIRSLPGNIAVNYIGEMPNLELPALTRQHHLFALPTLGENFGHAIFESLALGKPVLISDQTPWRDLARKKSGWDLPLNQPELFTKTLRTLAGFGQDEYNDWSFHAWEYARDFSQSSNLKEDYLKLFN